MTLNASGHSSGSQPASPSRPADSRPAANGSGPGQRSSGPNSGATPAVGPDGRQSGFRPANGAGAPAAGMPPGGRRPASAGATAHGPGANGAHGSITGYRRSDYAPPTAYPGSYGSGYSPAG